jgi:hypothetical protein
MNVEHRAEAIELFESRARCPALQHADEGTTANEREIFLCQPPTLPHEPQRFPERIPDFHFAAPQNGTMKRD